MTDYDPPLDDQYRIAEYDIRTAARHSECHEEIPAVGLLAARPCEAMAVALRIDPREWSPYPVCAEHVRAPMLSLEYLSDSLDLRY